MWASPRTAWTPRAWPASTAAPWGKTGNCQVGVSLHLVTDHASAAVDWRLFLPASWDPASITDPALAQEVCRRRQRCKISDDVGHREKWR